MQGSFRMQATRATFLGLPRLTRRSPRRAPLSRLKGATRSVAAQRPELGQLGHQRDGNDATDTGHCQSLSLTLRSDTSVNAATSGLASWRDCSSIILPHVVAFASC